MRLVMRERHLLALGCITVFYFVYKLSLTSDKLQHSEADLSTEPSYDEPKNKSIDWCQPLHFRPDDEKWPATALVSCPGSGNTWLRYLLMQTTGIYAGSVCRDRELQNAGFSAELISNGSVCVVKTHQWGLEHRKLFDRAVLLVRSPYEAILSDFHRQKSGESHTGHATPEDFTREDGKVWRNHVGGHLYFWYHMNMDWLNDFEGPLHIVLYEDLVTKLEPTLLRVLYFLEIPFSEYAFQCALERSEGIFHRKKAGIPMELFDDKQKEHIEKRWAEVNDKIRERNQERKYTFGQNS